ncbi:NADPH oxidase 5-like isoform X1 [Lytechinus variegatus]|uniref:NADPH oxidase 5-like isoform X1 n=1 Tax=Lytechinus variegatus TaxID=7654 RepID=UPI001BB0DA7D|nr:NADPH oxidase 5-like isoform X1 [Lytechinus variegatus]
MSPKPALEFIEVQQYSETCEENNNNQVVMTRSQERDEKWLAKLEKRFNAIAGDDNQIDLEEFKQALNVKKSFFAERFFELIDTDQSGSISLKELIGALRLLVNGTEEEKLHFLFRVYDADGSGFIDFDELKTVLNSCTAESALTLSDETLTELTEILFEDADVDGDGQVSFEELSEQLQRYPAITANLSISAAEWLNPRTKYEADSKKKPRSATASCCSYHTLRNHFSVIVFTAVFVLINAGLAAWGAYEGYQSIDHERNRVALCIARSSGRCLSFNCCFILVLMLRKLLTLLRNSILMSVLPLDQHVSIHKVVGVLIIILTLIHVLSHLTFIGLIYEGEKDNGTLFMDLISSPVPGVGLVEGACNITGFILILVLIIMTLCSLPFIRRNGYFKVFYWTHQLCIIFWGLLIIHSKYFWIWFVAPGAVYIVERFLRLQVYRRARFGIIYIQEGYVLPANVVHLVIQRPPNFKFHAGEYIYVNIPTIASHEWHPFTISSAPEQQEFLSLHIRSLGHWTKRLYEVFKERELDQLKELPENIDIDNEDASCLSYRKTDQPLDVVTEVSSTKTTPTASPSHQRDTPLDSPSKTTRQCSPQKGSGRKRNISGETNSGFQPETPTDSEDTTTSTIVNGTACNSNNNDDLPLTEVRRRVNSMQGKLPGIVNTIDFSCQTEETVEGGLSPAHFTAIDERSPSSRFIKGKGFKLKPLNSPESKGIQDGQTIGPPVKAANGHGTVLDTTLSDPPQGDNDHTPPVIIQRTESNLSRRLFNKKFTEGRKSGRPLTKNSRKKLRRNHTLHSLDVARTLGDAPHTGMEVILDGPYGAPAQHIMEAEHAVLIGAGIGITPFASILQSIHERYKAAKKHCPNCHHAWVADASSILKTRKVDFFWINRQQRSFEWFISLLYAIELEQADIPAEGRFLDIHLYMTSALSPSDMKAIGLHVALDLIHKKNKRDTITGLMTRTQPGRPDWEEVFQKLKKEQKGRITVFFCGSPALGKIIRTKCLKYQMDFRKENF